MADVEQLLIFLGAAVVLVPLAKRVGLGSVFGYLVAGAIIGPSGFGLIHADESSLHFAELGVVLLLFVIGLELQLSRLRVMRRSVFGLGGAQVLLSGLAIAAIAYLLDMSVQASLVIGFALALSSTAFALQVLAERKELTTRYGRSAFSILLFQDLAAIPLIAMVPLLAVSEIAPEDGASWVSALRIVGVLAGVVIVGRFALRALFRLIAAVDSREAFMVASLFVAIGVAVLVEVAGLSMALGAFLAGVLLADSEYRHQIEADIEPFKGILLGLFFISVGMSLNLRLLAENPLMVLTLVAALVAVKFLVLILIAKVDGQDRKSSMMLGFALSQGGEFAFVIFGVAAGSQILDAGMIELLILVVTVSMAVTPVLLLLGDRIGRSARVDEKAPYDVAPSDENRVIIAGFGRVGQIIGRILRARKIGFTALEVSSHQVDFVKKFGNKIYYGDASRPDLLHAAKADQAEIFIIAVEDADVSVRIAEAVKRDFPHLKIFARARNRNHAYRLMDAGVESVVRETFWSSLKIAEDVLSGLGLPSHVTAHTIETFRDHDERRLAAHHSVYTDEEKMADLARAWAEELEELFQEDPVQDGERA